MWDVVVNPNLVLFLCIHDVLSCLTIHDLLARAALIPAYSVGLGRLGSNYWVSLESANGSSWAMTIFFGIFSDLDHWRHYTKTLKNQQLCQKPTIKIFDTLSDTILTYMQIVNWPKTCAKLKSSLSTMFLQTRNNTKKKSFSKSTSLSEKMLQVPKLLQVCLLGLRGTQ